METFKYNNDKKSKCLECGTIILSKGRIDRKFCCEGCKNSYHNRNKHKKNRIIASVDKRLKKNYEILENLINDGQEEIVLFEAINLGFNVNFMTSYTKVGKYVSFCCFNITYRITETRIFNIKKISERKD